MKENILTKTEEKNNILYRVCLDFPEKGVRFIDLTPSLINTKYRISILSSLVNHIENEAGDIDGIISPDARGFIWGMGVATLMNTSFIPVRKTGKLPMNCVNTTIEYNTEYSTTSLDLPICSIEGKRIMFVDDVYATGGTYRACKKLVELSGGTLVGGAVIYNVGIEDNPEIFSLSNGDL